MKNKIGFLMVLAFVLTMLFAIPVFAEQIPGINIPDADPSTKWHEVTLKQTFEVGKLGNKTVVIDGKEIKDVVIAFRKGDTIYIESLGEIYKINKTNAPTFDQFVKKQMDTWSMNYMEFYPYRELISINGVPWQNTEYGVYLKEQIEGLRKLPANWEIAQNPAYNGMGAELQDIEAPAPDQNLPVGKNITLTMTLNKASYTIKTKTGTITKTPEVAPFAKNGVTLVPVRGVFEAFNAYVQWLPKTQEVKVKKGSDLIALKINSKNATVNGKTVKLLEPAQIVKGRTVIPLRFISENIGYNVLYVAKTKQIIITD